MKPGNNKKALSLAPLSFDEAVTNILKVKPEPRPPEKKAATRKRGESK
jgi:hypothetical protein